MQSAPDHLLLHDLGCLLRPQPQRHRQEADEPVRQPGKRRVQFPPCSPVRLDRVGPASERLLQDGHLPAQCGQVAGPLRVRSGGEQDGAVDSGLVQQPHVRLDRVVDMAVRVDDH